MAFVCLFNMDHPGGTVATKAMGFGREIEYSGDDILNLGVIATTVSGVRYVAKLTIAGVKTFVAVSR